YGSLDINWDGTYTYRVNNDNPDVERLYSSAATLTDTFSYTIQDYHNNVANGTNASSTLTVSISGNNDYPRYVTSSSSTTDTDTITIQNANIISSNTFQPATGNFYVRDPDNFNKTTDYTPVALTTGIVGGYPTSVVTIIVGGYPTSVAVSNNTDLSNYNANVGLYGTLYVSKSVDPVSSSDHFNTLYQGDYKYVPNDDVLNAISSSTTLTESFQVTVYDQGRASDTLTYTADLKDWVGSNASHASSGAYAPPYTNTSSSVSLTEDSNANSNYLWNNGKVSGTYTPTFSPVSAYTGYTYHRTSGTYSDGASGTYAGNNPLSYDYTVDSQGYWSYRVDNWQDAVQKLGVGDSLTYAVTLPGTSGLTVTLNGKNDDPYPYTTNLAPHALTPVADKN
ncbi:MAG: VCBS domain-containing protein, partial [Methylococcaceae bacterium]